MSRIYYRGARGAIVCYDLTDNTSFERAKFWVNELKNNEEVSMDGFLSRQWQVELIDSNLNCENELMTSYFTFNNYPKYFLLQDMQNLSLRNKKGPCGR